MNSGATVSNTVDYLGTTRPIRGFAAGTAVIDRGAYELDTELPTCSGLAQLVNLNSVGSFTLPTLTQIPFGGSTDLGGVKYIKMAKGNTVVGPFTTSISMNCTDVGNTTISGQITDYAGNVSYCTTTVTTSDVTSPTLNSCAGNQSIVASSGCQAVVPDMTNPLTGGANFTDACGVTVTQSPTAGSLFSGTQTVTITAKDPSNNQTQCTAQITVTDATRPVFSLCPAAQVVTANASCQASLPNIAALATATDNCGTPTISQSPAAGTTISGTTVVTLTATDGAGNTNLSPCTVTVTLNDTTAPQITTCAPAQNVSLNASCQATVPNVVTLTTATDNCPAITVTQSPAAGTVLTGAGVRTIVVTATDGGNNTATCNVQLNVNDTTNPTITCPSSVANVNVGGACTAIAPNVVALTTASDNCGTPVITQSPVAGSAIPLGANIFTLTATDVNNNVSTCQVTVNAVDVTPPSITTCAPDRTLSRSGSCDQLVPNLTGDVVAVDNCTANPTVTQSPLAGTLITTDTVVTLTVTDESNNSSNCTANLTLVDDSDPVITSCAPPVTVNLNTNCQATVPDLTAGVSSTDNCGVASTTQLPIAGSTITADTIVTLTVHDTSGNIATCQTNVTVTDVINPTIDTCPASRTLSRSATCSAQVPDLVAETVASDNCTVADISQSPIAGTTITANTVVTITVTDGFGNTTTCTVNLTLVDDTAPVITLNGGANLAYLTGQIYTEQGATASDNCDASVTVTIGGDTVDNQTAGIYIVRYNAVDAAGNNAIEVTRQVTFTLNAPPVITITGSNPAVVECHTSYTDAGATAFDSDQGDITGDMITTGTVDVNTVGDYPIEYKVTDNAFTTVSETRIVQVRDTTPPVVTIIGATTVTHECHTAYTDLGATASDTCYGNITPDITVDNHVDENAVGDYAVNYTVIDGSGNQTTVTRTVQVRDTTIPVLTLIGDNPVDHECGTVYADLGVFADDSCDGDITALVVVNNPVDENSNTGTYTVTYNVNDVSGNPAAQITRTVNVRDTLRPVITLVGTPVVAVNIDTPYVEQGANASDVCDGTDSVTITGTVDVHNRGTYTLRYNAVDSNGNNAIEVLRSVVVSGPADPPVILQDPANLTVNYGVAAQFTVLASSSPTDPVTYRWTRNGVDLNNSAKYSGVTTDTLTINNSANGDEANYAVKATNSHGTTPSNSAALTVLDPAITQQPVDAAVPAGSTVNFTVVAVGSPTLQYQWFKDGTPVANGPKYTGATSATLSVSNSQPADQGDYFVRVTGADGNVDSEIAKLKVANPAIISQPVSITVDPGDTATFVVNVQGTPPILFRWRKNGVNLNEGGRFSGVNTSTLTISNVIEGDEGQYSCVVVGQQIVTSDNAQLTVNDPPVLGPISLLPVSGVLARGASGTLTAIIAAGTPPFSFQWKKDGININTKGAINGQSQVLTIQNTVDADAGNYTCVVTNSAGSATAVPVHISVGLTIFADLQDRFAEDGTPFTWSVGVGGAAGNLVYTWFKQDTNNVLQPLSDGPGLSGTQTDVLTFNPVDFGDAGRYQVEVSDTTDTVTSRLAKLTVVSQLPLAGGMGLALLAGAASLLGAKAVRRKKH